MKMIVSFVPYVPYVPVNRNRWRFRLALLKNGLEATDFFGHFEAAEFHDAFSRFGTNSIT
jgi:hypothetical protein